MNFSQNKIQKMKVTKEKMEQNRIIEVINSFDQMISLLGESGTIDNIFKYLLTCDDQSYKELNFEKFPEEFVDEFCDIIKKGSKSNIDCIEKDVLKAYSLESDAMDLFISEKLFSQSFPVFSCDEIFDYAKKVLPYFKKFLFDYHSNSLEKNFVNLLLEWSKLVPPLEEMRSKLDIL